MVRNMRVWIGLTCLALAASACNDNRLKDVSRLAAEVRITVTPPRDTFNVGEQVDIGYVVLDANGIVIDGGPVTWQVPPADQVAESLMDSGQFTFLAAGAHTWTVSLVDAPELTDSVTLTAEAVPAQLEITVDPERDFYAVGDEVALGYVVRDENGTELPGIGATWQAPPAADVDPLGNDRYRFTREGAFTWTVTLEAPWGLSESVTLQVDDSGPVLDIEVPERGDTIRKETPNAEVSVRGNVSDASAGLASVTVRTQSEPPVAMSVEPNGDFAGVVSAAPGLNTIVVEALDLAGNRTEARRSFLYAADFFWPYDDPDALVAGMEDAVLTDLAFDRGRPSDQPPFDPCAFGGDDRYSCPAIQDVASLLELALNNLDFAALQDVLAFHFPLVDEQWGVDFLNGFGEVSVQLEGYFDLEFAFSQVGTGQAKVTDLSSYGAGVQADVDFMPWTDSQGVARAGLFADLGMTGTLSFYVWLDLTTDDPVVQQGLCLLALNICNPNPPYDCLYDYLAACAAVPLPIASLVSVIDTPVLAGLDVDSMQMQSDILLALDQATQLPEATLARLDVSLGAGALDASALEDLTINLGTISFFGFQIDLGTFQIDTSFVNDLTDAALDPILNAMLPIIEATMEQIMGCRDENNPVCFVLPFFEQLLSSFAVDGSLDVADPFAATPDPPPLATVDLTTGFDEILFRSGFGGWLTLGGRAAAPLSADVDAHRDDDLLGVALLGGCLAEDPGFAGHPTNGKAVQVVAALDLVNQLLFAVWADGGMDLTLAGDAFDLDPAADVSGLGISLRPWLPVVVDECDAVGQVLVGWGDVHLDLGFTHAGQTYQLEAFASLAVPGQVEVAAGLPALVPDAEPAWSELDIQQLTVDGAAVSTAGAEADFVRGLVGGDLMPQLATALTDAGLTQLSVLLPSYDISDFPGIEPGEAVLSVGDPEPVVDQDRIILNADFVQ